MRLVVSKPEGSETATDEVPPRGGIGSRLKVCSYDEVEEGGGLRSGLGAGSRAKMSSAADVMGLFVQKDTLGGKDKERRPADDEGEMNRRQKKKGKKRTQVTGD